MNTTFILLTHAEFDSFIHDLSELHVRVLSFAGRATVLTLPQVEPRRYPEALGRRPAEVAPTRRDYVPPRLAEEGYYPSVFSSSSQESNMAYFEPDSVRQNGRVGGMGMGVGGTDGVGGNDTTGLGMRDMGLGGMVGMDPRRMPHFGRPPRSRPHGYHSMTHAPPPVASSPISMSCARGPVGGSWTPPVRGGPHNTRNVVRAAPVRDMQYKQNGGKRRDRRRTRPARQSTADGVEAGNGGQREGLGQDDDDNDEGDGGGDGEDDDDEAVQ